MNRETSLHSLEEINEQEKNEKRWFKALVQLGHVEERGKKEGLIFVYAADAYKAYLHLLNKEIRGWQKPITKTGVSLPDREIPTITPMTPDEIDELYRFINKTGYNIDEIKKAGWFYGDRESGEKLGFRDVE